MPARRKTVSAQPQLQLWREFVDEVRAQNPQLSYKEALIKAKPIYHRYKKQHGF